MMIAELLVAILIAFALAWATGHMFALVGFPIPDADRRIGCLDGLRGYVALLVMAHHFDLWSNMTRLGFPWGHSSAHLTYNFGPGGVALFFMTTGLVFYPRVLDGLRMVDWRRTYVSRVFRILPLQLVTIAAACAIAWSLHDPAHPGALLANLKALGMWIAGYGEPPLFNYRRSAWINAGVLWSLWYEWVFYLVLLPVMALARDLTRWTVPSWVLPAALLGIGLSIGRMPGVPAFLYYLPLFAFGMIAFELRNRQLVRRALMHPLLGGFALIVMVAAFAFSANPFEVWPLLASALFFATVASGNTMGGVLSSRGSLVLGECSFGLYLMHGMVLFGLFDGIRLESLSRFWELLCLPLAMIGAVLLAVAAHLGIERPAIRLGKRVAHVGRRQPPNSTERAALEVAP